MERPSAAAASRRPAQASSGASGDTGRTATSWGVSIVVLTMACSMVLMVYGITKLPAPAKHSNSGFLAPGNKAGGVFSSEAIPSFLQVREMADAPELLDGIPLEQSDEAEKVIAPSGEDAEKIRGAAPGEMQRRYVKQRESGTFTCFDGRGNFSSSAINDEYCDCEDGSDEPGTSACSGLAEPAPRGFSCGWRLQEAEDRPGRRAQDVVRPGAVNDGICDCCGGEDEWDGYTICPDRCAEAEAEEAAEASKSLAGSRAREALVARAPQLKKESRFASIDGGPNDAFLAVAAAPCLELLDGDYRFEVCIFSHVTQHPLRGKSGRTFSLGKKAKWAESLWENGGRRKDYGTLIMEGGDFCAPASAGRRSEIHFECADAPALLGVQESQVCVYAIRMQTPAACHPLHH